MNCQLMLSWRRFGRVRGSTIRKFRIVRIEREREVERKIDHYYLDAIISVESKPEDKDKMVGLVLLMLGVTSA